MDKIKYKSRNSFIILNHTFIKTDLFCWNEKAVYIILRMYADKYNKCFPSLNTLCKISGKSKKTIIKALDGLEEKKLLVKENRVGEKGNISNLYTLYEFDDVYKENNEIEKIEDEENPLISLSEIPLEELEKEIERRKKKEPVSTEPTKETAQTDSKPTKEKYKVKNEKSQDGNCKNEQKYSMEFLKKHFEYEQMVEECPEEQETIENVMQILYDSMNSSAKTVRVGRENKPKDTYINKMMKLTSKGILYAIRKYKEAREPIGNVTNYMRTLLYRAEEQRHLDNLNKQAIQSNQQNQRNDQGERLPFGQESIQEMEAKAVPKPKPKEPMRKANRFNDFPQRSYSDEEMVELEKLLLRRPSNT